MPMTALAVLKSILISGFLRPTFARKPLVSGGSATTIRGPHPVVCYSEMPLKAFLDSYNALSHRYQPYAIAIRKDRLFTYGGRPVIYGSGDQLEALGEDIKYLWVSYNPLPRESVGGYPIDWTHEREWRSIAREIDYPQIGSSPTDGIPLLMPPVDNTMFLPWVIVSTIQEVHDLQRWIRELPSYNGSNAVLDLYFDNIGNLPIISLEEIRIHLANGDDRWSRIDTVPYEETGRGQGASFRKIGWRNFS